MKIQLNGQPFDLSGTLSVAELVANRELNPRQIAVEINNELVPRERYDGVLLSEGDQVELVSLAGGG